MESSGKVPGLEPVVSSNFQSPFNGYLRDETVIAQASWKSFYPLGLSWTYARHSCALLNSAL